MKTLKCNTKLTFLSNIDKISSLLNLITINSNITLMASHSPITSKCNPIRNPIQLNHYFIPKLTNSRSKLTINHNGSRAKRDPICRLPFVPHPFIGIHNSSMFPCRKPFLLTVHLHCPHRIVPLTGRIRVAVEVLADWRLVPIHSKLSRFRSFCRTC